MENSQLEKWLGRLRGTATFVYIAALCVAVTLLVVGFIPKSEVTLALPTSQLSGLGHVRGVTPGVVVDQKGDVVFKITDPSLTQRILNLATTLPALLLVAEIARRTANMLRAAQDSDPFTAHTARVLTTLAKVTVVGGLAVWGLSNAAKWALSATMLESGTAVEPHQSPVGWLTVGLIFAAFAKLIAVRAETATVVAEANGRFT